jgi:hypothetical protein
LRYSFEKMVDGGYQVRLNGFFITYARKRDSKLIDELLKENGWKSREEYLNHLIENQGDL